MPTYNGWTNRETWLINVHYNPETVADVNDAKEDFENRLDILRESDPTLQDFIYDCSINWQELRSSMAFMENEVDDEEE